MPNAPIDPEPESELGGGGVRLGKLQLAIMRVLWRRGEASVSDVHEELEAERGLAPTTVATMLVKLEHKGVVCHRSEGRRFIYQPLVNEEQVRRSMVDELTSQLFHGDVAALVNLAGPIDFSKAGELAELRSLIAARERGPGGPEPRGPGNPRPGHGAETPARRKERP